MSFLGIRVNPDVARLLSGIEVPGDKCDVSSLHITLAFFEDNTPITKISKILESTYEIIHNFKPFLVTSNQISSFDPPDDKPYPVIAKVNSKELHNLNSQIKEQFDKNDIEYSKKFKDYKPHITLSYSKEKPEDFEIDEVDFYVHELVLYAGKNGDDRLSVIFPLKSPEKKKNACLEAKINLMFNFV
jgi:2'-5' RNA ligase